MRLKPLEIPLPKSDDEDYMKVWRLYIQADQDRYRFRCERDTWRVAFQIVAAILFAAVLALMVLCCSYFIYDNFCKPT